MTNNAQSDMEIKILLVDDKIENLIALEKTLAILKLKVFKATSGNDALKLMLTNDFAVALIDVMMPIINGFEVAKLMHSNENTMHIPIIFVTAIDKSESHMLEGLESGAVDFLYKPIDPIVLLSKVRVFVDLYQVKYKLERTIRDLHYYQAQLENRNDALQQLSDEDSLTKIPNRRAFEEQFTRLLTLGKRYKRNVALFFLDLDDFKLVNDEYGHEAGDLLLKTVSDRLLKASRVDDIVNDTKNQENNSIGRLGGDEFVFVAGDIGDASNGEMIAKRILKITDEPVIYQNKKLIVSLCIGIAFYPLCGKTVDELMRAADEALYKAKRSGKNTYCISSGPTKKQSSNPPPETTSRP